MPVHIGQMTTDVIAQPSSGAPAREVNELPPAWAEDERYRTVAEHRDSIRRRTCAQGYDD